MLCPDQQDISTSLGPSSVVQNRNEQNEQNLFCFLQLRKALLGSKRLVDLEVICVICSRIWPLAISDVVTKFYSFSGALINQSITQ